MYACQGSRDGGGNVSDRRGVSFVITVYDKEPYLEATIGSVLGQAGDFEREIIVVDDDSRDRSRELAGDLLSGVAGARVLTQENSGPARAMNLGVAAATMPVIKPMDGDDVLTDDATGRLLAGLQTPRVALVRGRRDLYANVGGGAAVRQSPEPAFTILEDPLAFCIRHSLSGCSEVLVRRDAYVACGGCDESVFVQDQSFIWRIAVGRHAFAITDELIAFSPDVPGDSLMSNRPQIEHDRNAAVLGVVRDHPDLPLAIRRLALRRVSGRAWKWARRINGRPWGGDATFWINALAYLPWLPRYDRLLAHCCRPYTVDGRVRLPALERAGREPVFPAT